MLHKRRRVAGRRGRVGEREIFGERGGVWRKGWGKGWDWGAAKSWEEGGIDWGAATIWEEGGIDWGETKFWEGLVGGRVAEDSQNRREAEPLCSRCLGALLV